MKLYKYTFARVIYLLVIQLPFFIAILYILLSDMSGSDIVLIAILSFSSLSLIINIWETLFTKIIITNKIIIHMDIAGYDDICKRINKWHDIRYSSILPAFNYNPFRSFNQDADKMNRLYTILLILLLILAVIAAIFNIIYG